MRNIQRKFTYDLDSNGQPPSGSQSIILTARITEMPRTNSIACIETANNKPPLPYKRNSKLGQPKKFYETTWFGKKHNEDVNIF